MTSEEKSAQNYDLNANERLLEIQEEIISIEKERLNENLNEDEKQKLKEKLRFLVSEQRMIFEARYDEQKDIKELRGNKEITDILKKEIAEDEKIEGELKEIIQATKERKWYETWWGKLLIIIVGTLILSLLTKEPINFSNLIS